MTLTAEQTRDTVDREWSAFIDRLTDLDESSWRRPTRCADWTVAELTAHVLWGMTMEADALRRARLGHGGRAEGRTLASSTDPAVLTAELRDAHAALVAELDALVGQDLEGTAPMPYGDVPVVALLDVYAMEAGIHTSDLAHALGTAEPLSAPVVSATETFLRVFLPLLAQGAPAPAGQSIALLGDTVRLGVAWPDGQAVVDAPEEPTTTVKGDDTAVLLFALGRLALGDAQLGVSGDHDLAANFKHYVPGP